LDVVDAGSGERCARAGQRLRDRLVDALAVKEQALFEIVFGAVAASMEDTRLSLLTAGLTRRQVTELRLLIGIVRPQSLCHALRQALHLELDLAHPGAEEEARVVHTQGEHVEAGIFGK